MKKRQINLMITIIAVFAITLFGCSNSAKQKNAEKADEDKVERNLAGGWHETEVTPEVEKAVDFVLQQMNTSAKLEKIVSVKTQIVKGRNFDIDFRLDNGEVWNTIVYMDLDGNFKMTKTATLKQK